MSNGHANRAGEMFAVITNRGRSKIETKPSVYWRICDKSSQAVLVTSAELLRHALR
jgi:hypothetical protein